MCPPGPGLPERSRRPNAAQRLPVAHYGPGGRKIAASAWRQCTFHLRNDTYLVKAHSEPPDCSVEPTFAQFAYDHCHELASFQAPYTVLPLVQVAKAR